MDPKPHAKYLGKKYPIQLQPFLEGKPQKPTISFDGRQFLVTHSDGSPPDLQVLLTRFYHKAAKDVIKQRLAHYQPMVKTKFKAFTIESHPDKWGSCSSERKLTFHWYLITYPIEALDYVVVHELCHLEHLNHDRSFWRLVGKVYPNYKDAQGILGPQEL